nr:Protein GrpE [Chlamydiota bacterium]
MEENEIDEEIIPEEVVPEEEEDFKSKYLRLLAEMENTRKRMQKERQEMTRFAIENVLSELLAPMDTFENALGFAEQMSEETRNWATGFQMILSQFKDLLHGHGVVAFSAMGEQFDPHRHDAVEVEEIGCIGQRQCHHPCEELGTEWDVVFEGVYSPVCRPLRSGQLQGASGLPILRVGIIGLLVNHDEIFPDISGWLSLVETIVVEGRGVREGKVFGKPRYRDAEMH